MFKENIALGIDVKYKNESSVSQELAFLTDFITAQLPKQTCITKTLLFKHIEKFIFKNWKFTDKRKLF